MAALLGLLALALLALLVVERARWPRHLGRPDALPPARPGPLPRASVIVPARDEARNLPRHLESLLRLDHPDLEIIVVEGGSADGTRAIAEGFAARDARVRVVDEPPLPPGWVGKPWACAAGRAQATGEWLLFTDADTEHAPDSLRRALQAAQDERRVFLTGLTRQRLGTLAERVAMPPVFTLIQAASGGASGADDPALAIANGQYILIEAATYDALGGHAAVAGSVVEDLALGRLAARAGTPPRFLDLTDAVRVRMYEGLGEMLRGWRKNVATGAAKTPPRAFLLAGWFFGSGLAWVPLLAAGGVGSLAALAAGALVALRVRRAQEGSEGAGWAHALLHPLGYLFCGVVLALSTFDRLSGRGPVWKGRRYPPERR